MSQVVSDCTKTQAGSYGTFCGPHFKGPLFEYRYGHSVSSLLFPVVIPNPSRASFTSF